VKECERSGNIDRAWQAGIELIHGPVSEEQLKAFLAAVKDNAELQKKLETAGDTNEVVAIAKASGFLISPDTFDGLKGWNEITEDELEGAQGGGGDCGGYDTGGVQHEGPMCANIDTAAQWS
jgi:predicted ribosomally synthesized peptide with nif11-like leader